MCILSLLKISHYHSTLTASSVNRLGTRIALYSTEILYPHKIVPEYRNTCNESKAKNFLFGSHTSGRLTPLLSHPLYSFFIRQVLAFLREAESEQSSCAALEVLVEACPTSLDSRSIISSSCSFKCLNVNQNTIPATAAALAIEASAKLSITCQV